MDFWEFDVFLDFMDKVSIMLRERLVMNLRNSNRHRRSFKRYINDMSILMTEANYTDEEIANRRNVKMTYESLVCLSISINLYLSCQLDFQKLGF